jgi:hypothetical protein
MRFWYLHACGCVQSSSDSTTHVSRKPPLAREGLMGGQQCSTQHTARCSEDGLAVINNSTQLDSSQRQALDTPPPPHTRHLEFIGNCNWGSVDQWISGGRCSHGGAARGQTHASNARSQRPATNKGNWRVSCFCLCVKHPSRNTCGLVAHRCFALPRSSILCGCTNIPGRQVNAVWGRACPAACAIYVCVCFNLEFVGNWQGGRRGVAFCSPQRGHPLPSCHVRFKGLFTAHQDRCKKEKCVNELKQAEGAQGVLRMVTLRPESSQMLSVPSLSVVASLVSQCCWAAIQDDGSQEIRGG